MKKLLRAFTLLELLVVIGIIGVLISLAAASYSTVQKKARDARRKSDLVSMQKFLEQCYSISNYSYPNYAATPKTITITVALTSITATCVADGSKTLTLTDPSTKIYVINSSTSTGYDIDTTLEDNTLFNIKSQQ